MINYIVEVLARAEDGTFTCLSAVGSFAPERSEGGEVESVYTITVNTLGAVRRNGLSWMESLEKILVIE